MAKPFRGEIEAELGGEKRLLRLGIGDLEDLEDRLDMGLPALLQAIADGTFRLSHLRQVLTAALEAGGWSGTDDDVRAMMQLTTPGELQLLCVRLFNVALGNNDDDAEATEGNGGALEMTESPSPISPSGAISNSAAE